jgi:hypothetical protein
VLLSYPHQQGVDGRALTFLAGTVLRGLVVLVITLNTSFFVAPSRYKTLKVVWAQGLLWGWIPEHLRKTSKQNLENWWGTSGSHL